MKKNAEIKKMESLKCDTTIKFKLTFDDNVANTGGGPGTWVEITCVQKGKWFVNGVVEGDSDADGVGSAIASNAS